MPRLWCALPLSRIGLDSIHLGALLTVCVFWAPSAVPSFLRSGPVLNLGAWLRVLDDVSCSAGRSIVGPLERRSTSVLIVPGCYKLNWMVGFCSRYERWSGKVTKGELVATPSSFPVLRFFSQCSLDVLPDVPRAISRRCCCRRTVWASWSSYS